MKRTAERDRRDDELLVLQAEAARCFMTVDQYLAAQQWSALFARHAMRARRRRRT
jgi:hypothetical protein